MQSVTHGLHRCGRGNDVIVGSQFADDLRGGDGMTTSPAQPATTSSVRRRQRRALGRRRQGSAVRRAWGRYIRVQIDDRSGPGEGADVIIDFTASQGDKIDLSAIDAVAGTSANDAFTFIGGDAFTGVAGQLQFKGGVLMGDINGDMQADFAIILNNVTTLAANSLVL